MLLNKAANAMERFTSSLNRFTSFIGLGLLALMFLFTTTDVILRYLFNRPIIGGLDITELMMVVVTFTGIAYVQVKKGHVSVNILVSRLPQRAQDVLESVNLTVALVLFALMTWQTAVQSQSWRVSEQTTATIGIPIHPFAIIIYIGCGLLCLVLISDLLKSLARVSERNSWDLLIWLVIGGVAASSPLWIHFLPWQMSQTMTGFIGFLLLFILLFSGLPIAFGMIFIGVIGMAYLNDTEAALAILRRTPYIEASSYTFAVLPMFALMGSFAYHSGLTKELYNTVHKWVGQLPGGIGIATVGASAGFAAVCGSSLASTATMGTVALPEMKRYKYDTGLACGCIVAGGTLGPLIPPSTILIIYGLLASQAVGTLFIAGLIPGILLTLLYMVSVYIRTKRNIVLGPPGDKTGWMEKVASLKGTWETLALFALVMGGIYFGIFTPTEAAGVGAFGGILLMLGKRRFSWQKFTNSLDDSLKLTCFAMLMFMGAVMMGFFLSLTRLPFDLADFLSSLNVSRYIIFAGIILLYIALGCVMEAFSLMVITIPIVFPLILALGFDPIWFGVIVVVVIEMGLITPPVGMNVFVLKSIAPDIPLNTMFRGIWIFFACMVVCVILLTIFPQIALFLPAFMK